MSLKGLLGQLSFAMKARKAMAEVKKTEAAGFDVKKMLWKGVKTLGLVIASACVPVIATTLSDTTIVNGALQDSGLPIAVTVAVGALIASGGKMLLNWWTHRDGPK